MRDLWPAFRLTLSLVFLLHAGMRDVIQAADPAPTGVPEVSPDLSVSDAMDHLEPLWDSMRSDVVSCEVKFRIWYGLTPPTPVTWDQFRVILQRYGLGEHLESVPDFLREVAGPDAPLEALQRNLWEQGQHRRHDLGLFTHIHDDLFSFVRDGGNRQIHLYEKGRVPHSTPDLDLFRSPPNSRVAGYLPQQAERVGDLVRLISQSPPTPQRGHLQTTNTFDWATGVPVRRLQQLESQVLQEIDYSGLTTLAGGITLPRCFVMARYTNGIVNSIDVGLLDDVRLNEPIPEQTFVVSKPRLWQVLDFRGSAGGTSLAVLDDEVGDLRTLISETSPFQTAMSTDQENQRAPLSLPKRVLLVVNGLALVSLGIWMWKRASLKEPKH